MNPVLYERIQDFMPEKIRIHPTTRTALKEYVKRVLEREKENLIKMILFGSVARGESTRDSDIDILIILHNRTIQDHEDICGIAADVESDLDYDENAYLQPVIIPEQDVKKVEFIELMYNVEREGITLYDSK